ncbi:MAG: hypothetical protein ABIO05_01720 [Ferruginibacter sp.]
MNKQISAQANFFHRLQGKIPAETLLANELATALNISKSEAYNKLKGNGNLTLQQVDLLCNKYKISFEIKPTAVIDSCMVKFTPFYTGQVSIGEYIQALNIQMQKLTAEGIIKLSCSTDDVPFFHLFKYKELTAFKLHFWDSRIFTNRKNKPVPVFDFKKQDTKILLGAHELHKVYQQIPCTEIWTKSELLIIIDQIRYAIESKLLIDKKLQKVICEQLL